MMQIELRSETPGDEEAIDMVLCRAFGQMDEANLVRMYRERYPGFDRRYSLTAWDSDDLVGYALYLPLEMRLTGEWIRAVALSPVAVVPERQGRGIGGRLIRSGMERAKADGFAVAVTCGGPGFYTQHGYEECAYAAARVSIDVDALPAPTQPLTAWPVSREDLGWLIRCHDTEWRDVDFCWRRGEDLREWRAPFADTVIWRTPEGRRAAYTERVPESSTLRMIIGDDAVLVRDVIATVKPTALEQHPSGWLARNVLESTWGRAEAKATPDLLACSLQSGILNAYRMAVDEGTRPPGHLSWPLALIVCG